MATKILTGALAIVRVNGEPIGKMKDIRIQETIRRTRVGGLGTILPKEQAATEWSGSLTCSFYEINYNKSGIKNAIRRDVANLQDFEDQLVLDNDGVQIDIFRKVTDLIDPDTKLIKPKVEPYATVTRCQIEGDNVEIVEGQVSGRNQSFSYLDPVLTEPDNPEEA